jgi:2,3-diketo-5-methylthio-1-phosphopentane phosphatase
VALFVDFDNTITLGDVLDRVIERFSANDDWRVWETQWQSGRISAAECLARQIGGLRASRADLIEFVKSTDIDPAFASIVAWARSESADLCIVSDNFEPLVNAILDCHHVPPVQVRANRLDFGADQAKAIFPWRDPNCPRCAHCKAQHLRSVTDRVRVYVGDGLSDMCAAQVADIVFAKDRLATELSREEIFFQRYSTLDDVFHFLRTWSCAALIR